METAHVQATAASRAPRDGPEGRGAVRAVLHDHLLALRPRPGSVPAEDPNALLAVGPFADHLEQVRAAEGEAALRALAHDYVALWARTFRTLVRHLRGRPDRTLRLFCAEVYPFLRGDQRAARIEDHGRNEARVLLADDLPPAYLAGLLESFVALSGADATARPLGRERFHLAYHLHPRDAAARTVQWLAGLRIPLLLTAALSVVLGTAAAAAGTAIDPWHALLLLVGAVAAQSGANALHDLGQRDLGPLARPSNGRPWRWFQAIGSYAVAATALVLLVLAGNLWLLGLAAGGLAASIAYTALRDHGLGPFLAAIAHGPLIVAGALGVLTSWSTLDLTDVLLLGAAPGLLTAGMLYLDDIADRPLDEAGGKRTLAVRLPQVRNLLAFTTLLAGGVAAAVAALLITTSAPLLRVAWFLPSLVLAVVLVREVRDHLDDPRALARSRILALGLHVLTTLTLVALILESP